MKRNVDYLKPMLECLSDRLALSVFTVTNTLVDGAGSLFQALTDANQNPGFDEIHFDIPGEGGHLIDLTSIGGLDVKDSVMIDGFTQSGSQVNSLAIGNNSKLNIELRSNFGRLQIEANDCVLQGLAFNGGEVYLDGKRNEIRGCFFGTDSTGLTLAPPLGPLTTIDGMVSIYGADNIIGGVRPADRNVISGGDYYGNGVYLLGSKNHIVNNYIGLDRDGERILGNYNGIGVFGIGNVIGGLDYGAGNVISGNKSRGIRGSNKTS